MRHLERAKPDGWMIEVSEVGDTQHMVCNQSLVHILVHKPDEVPAPASMGIIYQYCVNCKTAVRVL